LPDSCNRLISIHSISFLELAGPTLTAESIATADAEKKMNGSVIIVSARTIEEVRDAVNGDPYWVGDVVRTGYCRI
jgi:uncharacterized protein YciI